MITYYTKEGKFKVRYYENIPLDKLDRKKGPALVDGILKFKLWYTNGLLHRLDGPAVIWGNGKKEWWINGKKLCTKKVETWIKENNINLKTKQHQTLFILIFI